MMIRAGDYLRDALAVLFLLMALNTAWDADHRAAPPDYLIPVTLLSILTLALPYLSLASILPRAVTLTRLQHLRLVANAPYLAVIIMALVNAYRGGSGGGEIGAGRGVGLGVMLGLVGVVLAAQGRASEVRHGATGGVLWTVATAVLAGAGVVLSAVTAVLFIVEYTGDTGWGQAAAFFLELIFFACLPLLAVRGVARGDGVWRDVAVLLGVVGFFAALWAQGADETMSEAWSLRLAGPQVLLWPAIGAAAAAPGIAALVTWPDAGTRRANLAGRLLQVVTVVAVVAFLMYGFRIVETADARGVYMTGVVLSLLLLVVATLGRNSLVRNSAAGATAVVGAAFGVVVLALVQMVVLGAGRSAEIGLDMAAILTIWIVFAIASAVAVSGSTVMANVNAQTVGDGDPGPSVPADDIKAEDESIWAVNGDDEGGATDTR